MDIQTKGEKPELLLLTTVVGIAVLKAKVGLGWAGTNSPF